MSFKKNTQILPWLCGLMLCFLALPCTHGVAGTTNGAGRKIQVADRSLAAEIAAHGGRLIADYSGYQLFEFAAASASALTHDSRIEWRDDFDCIELHAARLNTRAPETEASRKMIGNFAGKRLHLVQFAGPVQPQWREELLATGVTVVCYIPENAYLVYGDATNLARLQQLAANAPHIQWDGPYLDAYKIHPLAQALATNAADSATNCFDIQLVADDDANSITLQLLGHLQLAPLKRCIHMQPYVDLVACLNPADLAQVASRPDVICILPFFPRRKSCERQDEIIAGNLLGNAPAAPGYLAWLENLGFNSAQFTNFIVDLTDSGVDNGTTAPNHFGLYVNGNPTHASRIAYNRLEGSPNSGSTLQGCDGHGNINAHIIGGYDDFDGFPFADTNGFHYGLGVCPFVSIGSSVVFDPGYTFPDFGQVQADAWHNGARVSNNSWDTYNSAGVYDGEAQYFDMLVRNAQPMGSKSTNSANHPMVIVFAAGDDGPKAQTVDSPGTAKNVISVGAAENVQAFGASDASGISDSQADSANDIASFSSRGPCADGRMKPDLMAPGTHVSGGVMQAADDFASYPDGIAGSCYTGNRISRGPGGGFWPAGQQFYTASSGTSQAAPCVTGGCALVMQYFLNQYGALPSPAMTKAFLINSARYLTGAGANDTLPSANQGMGEMNLGFAFDGAPRLLRDQVPSDLFTNSGQVREFSGVVADTNHPFRVTLAWTDAPGSTTGHAWNNNLDLTVSIGTNTYKGNVFSGAYSVTGGSADAKNNVENVFLPAGTSGNFTVTVTATSINSDGVPNNGIALDQDFALVIYNAATNGVATPRPNISIAVTGTNISVSLNSQPTLHYTLQYKNSLSDTNWTSILPASLGTGKTITLQDPNPSTRSRFYRVTAE